MHHRITTAAVIALLALLVASPGALAQTQTAPPDGITNERFATDETRQLSEEITEAEARYERNEKRIDTLTQDFEMGRERDQLRAENAELDDSVPPMRADLVDARYEAIQAAPVEGNSPEEQVASLEEKADALEQLEAYSGDVNGDTWLAEDEDVTEAIAAEQEAVEEEIAAIEEGAASAEPAASPEPAAEEEPVEEPVAAPTSEEESGPTLLDLAGRLLSLIITVVMLAVVIIPVLLIAGLVLLVRRGGWRGAGGNVVTMFGDMRNAGIKPLSIEGISFAIARLYYMRGESTPPGPSPSPRPGGPTGNGPTVGGPENGQEQGGGGPRPQQQRTGRREMTPELRARLQSLNETMHEQIVGQEAAVSAVSNALRRRLAGGFGGDRPASFLFLGPTGVGKTEVTKVLADVMYQGEASMVRLDMAEYGDKYTVQRLTGAPPGYVGYEEGGQLTGPLIEDPERVVLMDEIEKAHADTWNILLGVLDDGRLTDGQGTTVSFGDSVVILTSNLLAEEIREVYEAGGELDERAVKEGLVEKGIKREIVNRIGQIVTFHSLSHDDITEIARRMLRKPATQMMQTHGVEVSFSEAAISLIADMGYEPAFGSRPLRGVIEREVEDRLSDMILDGRIGRGSAIEFDVREVNGEPEIGVRPAKRTPR